MAFSKKVILFALLLSIKNNVLCSPSHISKHQHSKRSLDVKKMWENLGHERSKRGYSENYYYQKPPPGPIIFDSDEYESDTPPPDYDAQETSKEIYFYPTPNVPLAPPKVELVKKDEPKIPQDSYGAPQNTVTEATQIGYAYTEKSESPIIIPSAELMSIAEQHIMDQQKSKSVPQTNYPAEIKAPSTSYGVPYAKVSVPSSQPNTTEAAHDTTTAKSISPAFLYGIPDTKIEKQFSNGNHESRSAMSESEKPEDVAKPYNLISSSYGAPLKSVTGEVQNGPTTETNHPISEPKAPSLPHPEKEIKHEPCGKYVLIPIEEYMNMNFCYQKSISYVYSLQKDGSLVKE